MIQHGVSLQDTREGRALIEVAEDRVAEVINHHLDPMVEQKPSKITIEITLTPDGKRKRFGTKISSKVSLAPREGVEGEIYGTRTPDGKLAVAVFDPAQFALPGTADVNPATGEVFERGQG